MKPLKLAVPLLLIFAALVAAAAGAPRAYDWYLSLRYPASPKAPVGSAAWAPPSGSVAFAVKGEPEWLAYEPPMSRQEADAKLRNPLPPSPEAIASGNSRFIAYCSHCHGADGKGQGPVAKHAAFPPPNLTIAAARRSEGFLYATIRNGGAMMPAQGHALGPRERWEIVHFLKSIAQAAPPPETGENAPATSTPATVTRGDAAKGKLVFEAECSACHDAASDQEIVGPGLQNLFRWPEHQAPDGSTHATHTVRMIRRQILEGGGAMPPVTGLGEQDLADLLAYLQTL